MKKENLYVEWNVAYNFQGSIRRLVIETVWRQKTATHTVRDVGSKTGFTCKHRVDTNSLDLLAELEWIREDWFTRADEIILQDITVADSYMSLMPGCGNTMYQRRVSLLDESYATVDVIRSQEAYGLRGWTVGFNDIHTLKHIK